MYTSLSLRKKALVGSLLGLVLLVGGCFVWPQRAAAEYVEHNLIDDAMYIDAASMSHGQIQSFLEARGGYIAGYYAWSDRDNASVRASQIIYEAAQDYGISPKVILATLQKEQSLVTARNPTNSQLNFAMGYGCPDSSGCGSNYSGFYRQIDNATWQLRFNYERGSGNNVWWNSSLSYPCNGPTRYYSAALKPGRHVTFYDDHGNAYKVFTINNASTGSLYCYTPHAYPGSSAQYYSGSYNFVAMFELWFGSTQPAVVVASPLRVTSLSQGVFTSHPVTVSFDLKNNANWPVGIGQMSVAVRDQMGNNHDFGLQQVTIPARGTYTYTATQTFSTETTYTFWITNNTNGQWSDTKPSSASIDNLRRVVLWVPRMPTITVQPTASTADARIGKNMDLTFTVRNNSGAALDIGKLSLALRGPNGSNLDLPLQTANLAAGASHVYTASMTPGIAGSHHAFITATRDNGVSWNETNWPAAASGQQRNLTFTVKSSPTITQSPTLSAGSPRVGQSVTASFRIRNFGDQAVWVGRTGLAIRDPLGRNADPASADVTVNANSEYTFTAPVTFTTPGTHTMWITVTRNNGQTWDDTSYPSPESDSITRRVTFTVLPNPTVTAQPTITTSDPRDGGQTTATFTLHNYTSQMVNAGSLALAVRDPLGRNADFELENVSIAAGQDYVYNATNTFTMPGTYTAWITSTRNNGQTWDDTTYPAMESAGLSRAIQFVVKPNPTIMQGPTLSIPSPQVGQATNISFQLRNFINQSFVVGRIGVAIRGPNGQNFDVGSVNKTLSALEQYTFQMPTTFTVPGTHTMWITVTQDNGQTWNDTTYPAVESGSVQRRVQFTVQP
ncbi:MAG TPA: hypothetical protein VJ836_07295 [Candidatus Saccharimonadales bacterium]|nr:hypothetical protein [Candidatus Saccharimonadales bacterium]